MSSKATEYIVIPLWLKEKIDEELCFLESTTRGAQGETITDIRGQLRFSKPLEPIVSDAFDRGCRAMESIIDLEEQKEKYLNNLTI